MATNEPSRNERDFFKIVTVSTSLAFGALAAFLYSLKDIGHDTTLVFSVGTVITFIIGAAAGWAFWRVIQRLDKTRRR